MTIEIPDSVIRNAGLTEPKFKLELALILFQKELFTLAQAARFAGLHRMEFQQELGQRKIPVHYGIRELEEDMQTLNISFE
ncbi:MAG: UPF0175 family protein [Bacteroidota bacterium]